MYDKLIDTVSNIIKTYGVGILSDSKFWSILTDSYSFASDYSLKDTFKLCITSGYVAQIVALRSKRKKTISEIKSIINSSRKIGVDETALAASLFSIAIGIGSCNKKDFQSLFNASNSGSKPAPNPSPYKFPFKWNECLIATLIYLFGIISSIGATVFYSAMCNGWWLFFILIFMGVGQAAFLGSVMNYFESLKNIRFKNLIKSIIAPILIAIVANSLLSFAFFSNTFRTWFSHHLHSWRCDDPTFLSFILAIFYVFFITFGCIGCLSPDISITKIKNIISRRPFFISLSFILVSYSFLLFGPIVKDYVKKERILIEETTTTELNKSLKESRRNIEQDLSFRGIKLGISIDTAKGFLSNFTDTVDIDYPIEIVSSNDNDGEYIRHYYTYFREPNSKYQTLTQAYTGEPSSGNWDLKGELVVKNINLDNQRVQLKLYEQEGLVFAIVILPLQGEYSFHDFTSLKALYTKKYGTPEKEGDVYRWSYKNGFIAISDNFIIYTTNAFDIAIDKSYKEQIQAANREEERKMSEKRKNDSINAARIKNDSIRRIKNHEKAIDEI